jgi:rRNA-processing protein FCF1
LIVEDLEKGKFFEGFTFLLHPAVHKECDTENGRKQLDSLARFSSMGRIKLQDIDTFGSSIDVDESIVESARRHNAILYTRDKRMYAIAASKNVFFLT